VLAIQQSARIVDRLEKNSEKSCLNRVGTACALTFAAIDFRTPLEAPLLLQLTGNIDPGNDAHAASRLRGLFFGLKKPDGH